jgi:hypothetical protein
MLLLCLRTSAPDPRLWSMVPTLRPKCLTVCGVTANYPHLLHHRPCSFKFLPNSGDIIINSIPVKAGRPCADMDCILEQRKTFVKRTGRVADRRGNTLAAGRGGGEGDGGKKRRED